MITIILTFLIISFILFNALLLHFLWRLIFFLIIFEFFFSLPFMQLGLSCPCESWTWILFGCCCCGCTCILNHILLFTIHCLTSVWMEIQTLHVNDLLKELLIQLELVPTVIELSLRDRGRSQMLETRKVWMCNGVPDRDAFIRRKLKHAREKVKCKGVRMWNFLLPFDFGLARKSFEVVKRHLIVDKGHVIFIGHAEHLHNFVQLTQVVLATEDSSLEHKLSKDTSNGPHV